MANIYVHVPFCRTFCKYCGFYSELSGRNGTAVAGYVKSLEYEIRERRDSCTDAMHTASCDTLYFGGGTPSLLSPEEVCSIASAIGKRFGIDSFDEFTLEANPDDIAGTSSCNGYLSSLRSAGVNRLSLGIQSFDDARLKFMNRRHDAAEAVAAFEAARNAGFDNISCDLIFGYGGLSLEGWKADINELLALKPEHVSCYQMSIERGSALEKLASSGRYSPLPDDECADQYALLQSMLAAAGYEQYEVSNFALPGFRSRHNSSYWERTPYVGFGPAAHSFDGACIRRWNLPDLSRYDRCYPGSGKCFCQEELTGDDVFNEQVMLSLRRVTGLDPQALDKERLSMERPDLDRLLDTGLLEYVPGTGMRMVRIPASKLFVSDSIIEELFV